MASASTLFTTISGCSCGGLLIAVSPRASAAAYGPAFSLAMISSTADCHSDASRLRNCFMLDIPVSLVDTTARSHARTTGGRVADSKDPDPPDADEPTRGQAVPASPAELPGPQRTVGVGPIHGRTIVPPALQDPD